MKQRLLKLAFMAAAAFLFMLLVVGFAATALYLYLSTLMNGAYAALVIAGIALAIGGTMVYAVLNLVSKMKFGLRSALGATALGAVGPSVLRSAAGRFAGSTPLGSLAAMGFSYWMARRKRQRDD